MKISKGTLHILENFSSINRGLIVKTSDATTNGTTIRTINLDKTIQSIATVQEVFKTNVMLGDLKVFLGIMNAMDETDCQFGSDKVVISDSNTVTNITYATENSIFYHPDEFPFDDNDVSCKFILTEIELSKVLKLANILQLDFVRIVSDGKKVIVSAIDKNNPSSNTGEVIISQNNIIQKDKIDVCFDKSLINKLVDGDYTWSVTEHAVKLENTTANIKYYIATEEENPE